MNIYDTKSLRDLENIFLADKNLYKAIKRAFKDLYDEDEYLIVHKPCDEVAADVEQLGKHHVGERAIVFRFAYYLQSEISKTEEYSCYNLDCEYNRNGNNPKMVNDKITYPDLIIHKRTTNRANLLVMEFKTYWNSNIEDDVAKVKGFMSKPYNYKYGMVVVISEEFEDLKFAIVQQEKIKD